MQECSFSNLQWQEPIKLFGQRTKNIKLGNSSCKKILLVSKWLVGL